MKKLLAVLSACTVFAFAGCGTNNDVTDEGTDTNTTTNNTTAENSPSTTDKNPTENLSTKQLFDKAKAALGEMPSTVSLDEEMFSEFYGESDIEIEEFISEIPAMNVHATEITVVKFKEKITEDEAEAFFRKRQNDLEETWKNYLPDQYEIVEDSVVAVRGQYALFCVAENADKAEDAFEIDN